MKFSRLFRKESHHSNVKKLDYFLNYITDNFVTNDVGINLSKLGTKEYLKTCPINLESTQIVNEETFGNEIAEVSQVVSLSLSSSPSSIIWFKIKRVDQAINENVGPDHSIKSM